MSSRTMITDIGEIPENWEFKRIDETDIFIGDGNYSSKYPKESEFTLEGVPFISAVNLVGREISDNGIRFIHSNQHATLKKGHLKENDVLIVVRGNGVGKVALVPTKYENANINAQLALLRSVKETDGRYLYYLLSSTSYYEYIKGFVSGSAQPQLPIKNLKEIRLVLPPPPTQRRIADILSSLDEKIELNRQTNATLEATAQSIFKEWFVNFNFPGATGEMVESELGLIPSGWKVFPLETVCKRITDGSHFSPESVEHGYPMASVKDMNAWGFDISSCRHISQNDFDQLVANDCKPLKNDVLIAKDGSFLKHIFVVEEEIDLVILSSIAILRPNELINSYILSMILKQPSVLDRMKNYISGAVIQRIVLKDFRQFKIIVPPIDIQNKWMQASETLFKKGWEQIRENQNLVQLRDEVLPKLMNGEIDIYEPHTLRIRKEFL